MDLKLGSSLRGRLRNTDLPISKCLYPIFEAVVNSIYAIDDRIESDSTFKMEDAKIRVIIKRENNSDLFGGKAPISSIVIEDNGIGFDDNNYNSFCELDSLYRASRGCKGIGRLFWLKEFSSVEIHSRFITSTDSKTRDFLFTPNGIKNLDIDSVNDNIGTVITLQGINSKYKEQLSRHSRESIAKAIFEHCLWFFLREGSCPDIRIVDGDSEATNLSEIYDSYLYSDLSEKTTFHINEIEFSILHIRLQKSDSQNIISYCGDNRIVKDEKIKDIVGLYDSAISSGEASFYYKCFVTSSYLDERVASDRFSFVIPEKRENESQLETESTIYFTDIRTKVIESVKAYLNPFLKENIKAGKEKLITFVDSVAPYYKPILANLNDEEKVINPNSSDKAIDVYLHSKMVEKEHKLIAEGHDLLKLRNGESDDAYKQRLDKYFNEVQGLKQSDLTRYVLHRKLILELLGEALTKNEDGQYSKEERIHQIIMPMHSTSDDYSFNNNNLWIIDERLVFHHYLASDKAFSSMSITDCDSTRRPDVLLENMYDNPLVVTDKDIPPFATLRIIEFKRPMRDNMVMDDDTKNPIDQCIDYVEKIRSGKSQTKNGRPIVISEDIPAYCYILCDLTPSMQIICRKHDLRRTYDGLGFFGYKNELKIYFEVISFDQLLNSAKERNASFFNVLGISHD